jgi:hypothetical protein
MWLWVGVGLGALLAVSVIVAVFVAATLGAISREVTALHDDVFEAWAELPPSRAAVDAVEGSVQHTLPVR